jgi:hypothetical protein
MGREVENSGATFWIWIVDVSSVQVFALWSIGGADGMWLREC